MPVNHLVRFLPRLDARLADIRVRAVREADRVVALAPQILDILRAVFQIEVGAHLFFLFHEAQVPVGNAVAVEPVDGLADGGAVGIVDEEAMGNDADAGAFIGQQAQVLAGAVNHRHGLEQAALRDGEAVQAAVLLFRFDAPLDQAVGDFGRQFIKAAFEPFGGDLAHAAVKVGTDAVQVDAHDLVLNAHTQSRLRLAFAQSLQCSLRSVRATARANGNAALENRYNIPIHSRRATHDRTVNSCVGRSDPDTANRAAG